MRMLSTIILAGLLSGCQSVEEPSAESQSSDREPVEQVKTVATTCPAENLREMAGESICFGGDPAVLAMLPGWAKLPAGVVVVATNVLNRKGSKGMGIQPIMTARFPTSRRSSNRRSNASRLCT